MKVKANTSGVYVSRETGHVALTSGREFEVGDDVGRALVKAGVASEVKQESRQPKGKRMSGAPENKGS